MDIQNLIFDIGGVLLTNRSLLMLKDIGLSEGDASRITREVSFDDHGLWEKWEKNDISINKLISEYSRKYPKDSRFIEFFIHHGEYTAIPRPAVWEKIRELKTYYHLYLLSNYPEEWFVKHMMYADFMKDIDGMEISYMHHLAKPDPSIYRMLCSRYDLITEVPLL